MKSSPAPPLRPDPARIRELAAATRVGHARASGSPFRRGLAWLRSHLLRYHLDRPPPRALRARMSAELERASPDFVLLAPIRCGTTMLTEYLMQHPAGVLPLSKEPGAGSMLSRAALLAHMPSKAEMEEVASRFGVACTGITTPFMPNEAMLQVLPAVAPPGRTKIIVLLRDPVERTFAHWRWDERVLGELRRDPLWRRYPDFEGMLELELEALREGGQGLAPWTGSNGGGYLQESFYLPFLKRALSLYPREEMEVVASESFFEDPIGTTRRLHAFLGLPEMEPVRLPVRNSAGRRSMSPEARRLLVELFTPRNEALFELLGQRFPWQLSSEAKELET